MRPELLVWVWLEGTWEQGSVRRQELVCSVAVELAWLWLMAEVWVLLLASEYCLEQDWKPHAARPGHMLPASRLGQQLDHHTLLKQQG